MVTEVKAYKDDRGWIHSTYEEARLSNLSRKKDKIIDELFPYDSGVNAELKWVLKGNNYDKFKELIRRFDELV